MVKRDMASLKEMIKNKLEFTLEDGPKGPSAVNLKKID